MEILESPTILRPNKNNRNRPPEREIVKAGSKRKREDGDTESDKKRKPKPSANGTDVAPQVATDPDADLDDAAVERVWLDFKVPCSENVTDRMGAILIKRHKLQQKPPSTLLYDLRHRGKLLNPEDPWAVLNYRIWKNWQADQQEKSETVETAQRGWDFVGQLHDLEQFTQKLAITIERIHRNREKRIAEANGTSDPPENNGL